MATAVQQKPLPQHAHTSHALSSDRTFQQLINGDQFAWHRLDSRARPILMAFLIKRGLRHALAEEITQISLSALAHALTNKKFQSGPGSVAAYLFKVARREIAIAIAEKQLEAPRFDRSIGSDFWGSDLARCDDHVLWENTWVEGTYRYCLERTRAASPPTEYEAFELRVRRQMSVGSIAECLDMDVLEVSRAIHRTKKRLMDIALELRHEEHWLHEGRLPAALCR